MDTQCESQSLLIQYKCMCRWIIGYAVKWTLLLFPSVCLRGYVDTQLESQSVFILVYISRLSQAPGSGRINRLLGSCVPATFVTFFFL